MLRGIPRYWFYKMYNNYSRSQRFQNLIFQGMLRFQDAPKMLKISRFQRFKKWCSKIHWDLLRFQDPKIFKTFKILLEIHHANFPSFLKQLLKPIVSEPPKCNVQFVRPQPSPSFETFQVSKLQVSTMMCPKTFPVFLRFRSIQGFLRVSKIQKS